MLFPSKVTSYRETIFPQCIALMEILKHDGSMDVLTLFHKTHCAFDEIDSFLAALDFLFLKFANTN